MNPDVSTGPLTCLFARTANSFACFALFTRFAALARLLTHSWERGLFLLCFFSSGPYWLDSNAPTMMTKLTHFLDLQQTFEFFVRVALLILVILVRPICKGAKHVICCGPKTTHDYAGANKGKREKDLEKTPPEKDKKGRRIKIRSIG